MRSEERQANRVLFVDCTKLDCPYCGIKKRAQYVDTITHHFGEREKAAGDASQDLRVYKFFVSEAEWKAIRTSIVRRGGNYFRVASSTDGTYGRDLVVSSIAPSAKQFPPEMVETLTHQQATAVLFAAIESIPKLAPKAFTTSRGWKLLTDEPARQDKTWHRLSRYSGTMQNVEDILYYHGIPFSTMSGGGRYRTWCAWEWQHHDWERIMFDLDTGDPSPLPSGNERDEWRDEWAETLWRGGPAGVQTTSRF